MPKNGSRPIDCEPWLTKTPKGLVGEPVSVGNRPSYSGDRSLSYSLREKG